MIKSVFANGKEIRYNFTVKKVKNINLRIKPDGTVIVSANKRVPQNIVEDFVASKADCILKALDHYEKMQNKTMRPVSFKDGEKICVLGKVLTLRVAEQNKNSIFADDESLVLCVKDINDISLKQKIIEKWLRLQCESIVTSVCREKYKYFEKLGIPFPTIKFRRMTSRWGSCQPAKCILTFNTMLIYAPISCIEYVVFHEFTHFLHPNHSQAFYKELEKFVPDWKNQKKLLNTVSVY